MEVRLGSSMRHRRKATRQLRLTPKLLAIFALDLDVHYLATARELIARRHAFTP
jgi:hypothetical protein